MIGEWVASLLSIRQLRLNVKCDGFRLKWYCGVDVGGGFKSFGEVEDERGLAVGVDKLSSGLVMFSVAMR